MKKKTPPDDTAPPSPQAAALEAAAHRARRLLHRRALAAAAVGVVPVPGLDWAMDAALLSRLLPRINAEFGLTPEQLDRLNPAKREQVQKAAAMVGSVLIGKFITRDLVLKLTKTMGLRMTTRQASKYVPLAGQALSVRTYPVADANLASPIRLTFASLQAALPHDCGQWPADTGVSSFKDGMTNESYWNFGCSSQATLAAQVADPIDLVRSRSEGAISGRVFS